MISRTSRSLDASAPDQSRTISAFQPASTVITARPRTSSKPSLSRHAFARLSHQSNHTFRNGNFSTTTSRAGVRHSTSGNSHPFIVPNSRSWSPEWV